MADLIQLLPDHIANQIAAGEVVQRPASVVKELLENAVDAGATSVQLIFRDAGKELIQVVDDGCGMSPTDARMAFERHATSKIRNSDDLFAVRTMGFRGEALASIAAVSRVEMRTRTHNEPLGTRILIEDGRVVTQEACQCAPGTNFMVQHLFYNVPARRKFLRSDGVETRHMLDEFTRIALANPDIQFRAFNGTNEVYHLPAGKLSQRIVGLLGKHYRERIVPVSEETDHVRIHGYVGKPEFSKKRRGEQFFFVNGRYIRSHYLHHAVKTAFDKLIGDDQWPMYTIFLQLDASQIDINVHPTKQEIKFEDERLVYQYLRVAVKHALGQFSVAPMIDFDAEAALESAPIGRPRAETVTTHILPSQAGGDRLHASASPSYSNGTTTYSAQGRTGGNGNGGASPGWRELYARGRTSAPADHPDERPFEEETVTISSEWLEGSGSSEGLIDSPSALEPYQLHRAYIVHQVKSGYVLIDQQGAHERILYERYLQQLSQPEQQASQAELFPTQLKLGGAEADALRQLQPELERLGFEIGERDDSFEVRGLPADLPAQTNAQELISSLLDLHRDNLAVELASSERIALALARKGAVRRGQALSPEEQVQLVGQLFGTSHPEHAPSGQRCIVSYSLTDIERGFGR